MPCTPKEGWPESSVSWGGGEVVWRWRLWWLSRVRDVHRHVVSLLCFGCGLFEFSCVGHVLYFLNCSYIQDPRGGLAFRGPKEVVVWLAHPKNSFRLNFTPEGVT